VARERSADYWLATEVSATRVGELGGSGLVSRSTRRRAFRARHFVVWQSNCCPVTPRVAGPNNATYGPVIVSGSGRVLMSSAG
jgi:hypothetical protein